MFALFLLQARAVRCGRVCARGSFRAASSSYALDVMKVANWSTSAACRSVSARRTSFRQNCASGRTGL